MPCLLKKPSLTTPGIITFTHNEVLRGLPKKSKKVKQFLMNSKKHNKWIFGVHIQGDCSNFNFWPKNNWESFYMWSNPSANFLSNLQKEIITPLTCVNFLPFKEIKSTPNKIWDICVISRPSEIKRIKETLLIIKKLFSLKEDLKVIFVVPDPRKLNLGDKVYLEQQIDRNYFELPKLLFSTEQLKNISFISSSQESFGNFPISDDLMHEIISKSRFVFLNSHKEGVPRVLIESFSKGVPCILSENLKCGLNYLFNEENTLFIKDSIQMAANQIFFGLENYQKFNVDYLKIQREFFDKYNKPKLKKFLLGFIENKDNPENDLWYLDDLIFRLACHGRKHKMQFFKNEKLFFEWISIVSDTNKEFNEDFIFQNINSIDNSLIDFFEIKEFIKGKIIYPFLSSLKSKLIIILKKLCLI